MKKALAGFMCLLLFNSIFSPVFAQTQPAGSNTPTKTKPAKSKRPAQMFVPPPPPVEVLPTPEPARKVDDTLKKEEAVEDIMLDDDMAANDKNVPGIGPDYVLGPGDDIGIQDFTMGDLNTPYTPPAMQILPDGTLVVHPLGTIHAAGLTVRELTRLINQRMLKYVIKPDISVYVTKIRPNLVYILGEVYKPGLYTNEAGGVSGTEGVVASSASMTVTSALQKAGGIKESADVRDIRITRLRGTEPVRSNLWRLMVEGDTTQDLALQNGDVLFVPKGGSDFDPDILGLAANQHRRIRVIGAVNSPGLIDMLPDDDLLSVLARAGGYTRVAIRGWVLLSRVNRDGTITTQKVNFKKGVREGNSLMRQHIHPGDLIIVAESKFRKFGIYAAQTAQQVVAISLSSIATIEINKWLMPTGTGAAAAGVGVIPIAPIAPAGGAVVPAVP